MLMTSRKNVVGESRGKTMVQKRRHGRAPSIAAASISDFGIELRPARKKRKLYEICFQIAASTISVIASFEFSRWFQGMPACLSAYATTPMLGANMKSHSTPATAGATAYGQIR